MTQHTPGPWKVTGYVTVTDQRSNQVAIADNLSDAREADAFLEAQANARLIAAAPEMLAALKTVLDWAKHPETYSVPLSALVADPASLVRAAIAKAEGVTP